MDEQVLQAMFEASQQQNADKQKFTPEEASRFKKAFADPEFRRMFSEYMDELQDPKHREETEAYISQLEGEKKVPEGKELIRPSPGFVAKTHKLPDGETIKEKVFINIVQSDKIAKPSKTSTPKGDCWSVPYSVGPPHMEKDKKGENAPCFDCCFHPEALRIGELNKEFMNLLVTTAMDGIEEAYKRQEQKVKLDRDFHVVKGISYKQGQVPTMMIASANKEAWNQARKDDAAPSKSKASSSVKVKKADPPASSPEDVPTPPPPPTAAEIKANSSTASEAKPSKKASNGPAIKKGFLNSSKSSIYPEKIPTIRPKSGNNLADESDKIEAESAGQDQVKQLMDKMEKVSLQDNGSSGVKSAKADALGDSMKAVSTKVKAKPPAPPASENESTTPTTAAETESGPVAPEVIIKHREALSLGDFEGMKNQQVSANRPTELIYEIQLPKVTAPSKLVLDVSEKKLCLAYLDVYKLDMTLPYPVYDKKGKAAYDKSKKALKVTLPVQPGTAIPTSSSPTKTESSNVVTEISSTSTSSSPASSPEKAKIVNKNKVEHDRWVEKKVTEVSSSIANPEEEELSESKKLYQEVQKQAELAKKKLAEQQAQLQAIDKKAEVETKKETSKAKNATSTKTPENKPTVEEVDPNAPVFIESSSFKGRKNGYVFKRGDEGLGYYLDKASHSKKDEEKKTDDSKANSSTMSTTAEASQQPNNLGHKTKVTSTRGSTTNTSTAASAATTEEKTITFESFPYQAQQNKDTIALLIQVPQIVSSSVKVHVPDSYSLEVSFEIVDESTPFGMCFSLDRKLCVQGVDAKQMKYDVASKNMIIVLGKTQRDAVWHVEDVETWLQSKVMPSKVEVTSSIAVEVTSKSTIASENNTATPAATSTSSASTATKVKSIMSTMKFSTDFIAELD